MAHVISDECVSCGAAKQNAQLALFLREQIIMKSIQLLV